MSYYYPYYPYYRYNSSYSAMLLQSKLKMLSEDLDWLLSSLFQELPHKQPSEDPESKLKLLLITLSEDPD